MAMTLDVPRLLLLAPLCLVLPVLAMLSAHWLKQRALAWVLFLAALLLWAGEAYYLVSIVGARIGDLEVPWFGTGQSLLIATAYVMLLAMGLHSLATRRPRITPLVMCIVAVTLTGALLRVLYPPQIAHVDLKGGGLVDDILGFPHPATYQSTYGQTAFFTLGLLSSLTRTVRSITTANALIGALLIPITAGLLYRWTRSAAATVAVAILVALNPAFVRVAASEEARNISVVLFFASVLAMDVYALRREKVKAIVAVMLLLVLTASSRQDFIPLLLIPFLLLMERAGWRSVFRFEVIVAAVIGLLAALAASEYSMVNHRNSDGALAAFGEPLALLTAVARGFIAEPHPLINPIDSPMPLPLLVLVGLVRIRRASAVRVTVCVGLILAFGLTAAGWAWGPGSQLPTRLAVLGFALLCAGIGVADLWSRFGPTAAPWRASSAWIAAVALVLFVYGTVSGLAYLGRADPQTQEILFLERAVRLLPPRTRILTPELPEFAPVNIVDGDWPWRFPRSLLRKGRDLELARSVESDSGDAADRCVVFYRGLPCYTLGFAEGYYSGQRAFYDIKDISVRAFVEWWAELAADLQSDEIQATPAWLYQRRSRCFERQYIEHPLRADLVTRVVKPWHPFLPVVHYPLDAMELGFYRLSGPGTCSVPTQ